MDNRGFSRVISSNFGLDGKLLDGKGTLVR